MPSVIDQFSTWWRSSRADSSQESSEWPHLPQTGDAGFHQELAHDVGFARGDLLRERRPGHDQTQPRLLIKQPLRGRTRP